MATPMASAQNAISHQMRWEEDIDRTPAATAAGSRSFGNGASLGSRPRPRC
jgi:hypothetical protein